MARVRAVTVEHADVLCKRCGTAQRVAVRLSWTSRRARLHADGRLTSEARVMLRLFAQGHVGPFSARAA